MEGRGDPIAAGGCGVWHYGVENRIRIGARGTNARAHCTHYGYSKITGKRSSDPEADHINQWKTAVGRAAEGVFVIPLGGPDLGPNVCGIGQG
jgi:hypothetical protein